MYALPTRQQQNTIAHLYRLRSRQPTDEGEIVAFEGAAVTTPPEQLVGTLMQRTLLIFLLFIMLHRCHQLSIQQFNSPAGASQNLQMRSYNADNCF